MKPKNDLALLVCILLALQALTRLCLAADDPTNPSRKMAELRTFLTTEVGGEWENRGEQLRWVTKDEGGGWIIFNPKSSETGRLSARALGYFCSSIIRVFGSTPDLLLLSNSNKLTPELQSIAKALSAQVVDPPISFHAFVEQNCGCRWNNEKLELERTPQPPAGGNAKPAPPP